MKNLLYRGLTLCVLLGYTLQGHAQDQDAAVAGPDKDKLLEFYESQRYTEAANYLDSFYQGEVTDSKALNQLGYVQLMAGQLAKAEHTYLKLYTQSPTNLAVLFNLASIQMKRGQNEKAKTYYKEIVAVDANNFNAYKQLSRLTKPNEIKQKLGYLEKAIALQPNDAEVAFDLGETYFKTKLYEKAEAVLAPALKADSANLQLMKLKMPIKTALKKYNEAIATGMQLLKAGDSTTFVLNNLAKSYFQQLDYRNALKYFLLVERDSEVNEELLYNISLCYRSLKDYKSAGTYLNRVIAAGISAKTASYYGLLGDSYENVNKNEEAIAAYRRGLLFENNGSLYYNIALVYENKLNDKKNAIANYNLYLKNFKDMSTNPKLAAFIKNKIEELKR